MRIFGFNTCNSGSRKENLLSVTIFMVFFSVAEISTTSSAISTLNADRTTLLLPKSTVTKRPWPSNEFLRIIIDGSLQNATNHKAQSSEKYVEINSAHRDVIVESKTTSSEIIKTKRSLTPSTSFGFPLRMSAHRSTEDQSASETRTRTQPLKFIKISKKHGSMENRGSWQTLSKPGIIVANKVRETPGVGWHTHIAHTREPDELPPGFSKLTWPPRQNVTPQPQYSPVSHHHENYGYGTTGRPPLVFSTIIANTNPNSQYGWHSIPYYDENRNSPQIQLLKRPSVVIIKDKVDKVSSLHWGSSGSTLPQPVHHNQNSISSTAGSYILPNTINSIQGTYSSPYREYGYGYGYGPSGDSDTIIGNNVYHQPSTPVWYKPTLNQYTTVAPLQLTIKPGNAIVEQNTDPNKQIMLKIWSYLEDGKLKLQSQKEIPAFVLQGHQIKDGDILNVEHIPHAIRQLVSTSLNANSNLQTNHMDKFAVSHEAGKWQQIPVLTPGSSGWGAPVSLPVREKPVSLNYVIWGSSTTPSPVQVPAPTLPIPDDYQKYLQEYLSRMTTTTIPPKHDFGVDTFILLQNYFQNHMATTQIPIIQGQDPLRLGGDMNSFANMAILQMILTHLSKQQGDIPQSPKLPIKVSQPQNEYTRLQPPNRDTFWAYLYPIYQHFLSKRLNLPNINRVGQNQNQNQNQNSAQNTDIPFSSQESVNSYPSNPQIDYPISITEGYEVSNSGESLIKPLIPKTSKKRKRRKKCKKALKASEYNGQYGWTGPFGFLQPENVDFGYNFGNIDIMEIIKKKFYALLALKLAPVIIITLAAVLPLAFLFWPQVFKMLRGYIYGHGHGYGHHHHHPHHHVVHNPYPYHHRRHPLQEEELQNAELLLEHDFQNYPLHWEFDQNQYPQQQSIYRQDQISLPDNTGFNNGIMWGTQMAPPGRPTPASSNLNFYNYPSEYVASLVEKKYGDKPPTKNLHNATSVASSWLGRNKIQTTTTAKPKQPNMKYSLDPPTKYNLGVMQTLMKNRNINPRIPKGSIAVGRSVPSNPSHFEGINQTDVGNRKRERLKNTRVVQIPSPISKT